MKPSPNQLTLIVVLMFIAAAASAEDGYVTDRLLLGMYADANTSSERIKVLVSGEAVEILERKGAFAQVILDDATTGWVKSAFIVSDPPAKLLVAGLEGQKKALEQELIRLRNQLNASKPETDAEINQLKEKLIQTQQQFAQAQKTLDQQAKELEKIGQAAQQDKVAQALPNTQVQQAKPARALSVDQAGADYRWFYLAFAVAAFIAGLVLGMRLVKKRLSKRFPGFALD